MRTSPPSWQSSGAVKLLIHRGVSKLREDADALRPVE